MENEKSNKLIAEFMGIDSQILSTGNIHSWSDSPFYYITKDSKEKVMKGISEYSKYHTSWDWLMPVVGKVIPLTDIPPISTHYDMLIDGLITGSLDQVYNVCVEVIKLSNNTNK